MVVVLIGTGLGGDLPRLSTRAMMVGRDDQPERHLHQQNHQKVNGAPLPHGGTVYQREPPGQVARSCRASARPARRDFCHAGHGGLNYSSPFAAGDGIWRTASHAPF